MPVGLELVRQTKRSTDPKDGKEKRRAEKTKNAMSRDLLQQAVKTRFRSALRSTISGLLLRRT